MLLLIQAIVLGLLQGLTEFLPVSSSGHLQGVPYLLGWDSGSLAFDVMVHAGTLLAVVWYFRADLLALATRSFGLGEATADERRGARLMVGLLAIGTLPAAFAGFVFADVFEAAFASPRIVAGFLYLTAVLLWSAERLRRRRLDREAAAVGSAGPRTAADGLAASDHVATPGRGDDLGRAESTMRVRDAVVIGLAQALAIFPGVSRAGATIAAGMGLGLSRTAAARFSFLLSIPVIVGAAVVTVPDLGTPEAGVLPFGPVEIAAGVAAAALSGYWAIRTLLQVVQRRDLLGFARYVLGFATILLAATFILE